MTMVTWQGFGMVSVIVPCWNQLEFTRQCVAALFQYTKLAWELVVVDNGSTDGTGTYFQGVRDAASVRVEVITNSENLGFPAACNQGLEVARGDYLVLLNNDTVVTDAWANQLVAPAESNPKIGMVGPMLNYAMPPQCVEKVPYSDLESCIVLPSGGGKSILASGSRSRCFWGFVC